MAVRAYFSGIESGVHFGHCVKAKVKHVLTSYWQFYQKDPDIVKRRKKKYPWMDFLIDSGAHTFITDWQKFMGWTRKQFEEYVENYVKWIRANRQYVSAVVEFDIDHTLNMVLAGNQHSQLGASIIESWQKEYFIPLQKLGIDVIYVWHEPRRMEGWEEMCGRFDYVGLPGYFSSEADFNKYMTVARRYTTRVHGFAATKQLDFRDIQWYSIDSITWKTGEMYGTLIDWDSKAQKLVFEDDKTKRINYREKLKDLGFDADGIINDTNYKEVTRYALFSMRQMEAFYENKYASRLFYYALRLPHRDVLRGLPGKDLMSWWAKFRPDTVFKQHCTRPVAEVLKYLSAISAVQNGDINYLGGNTDAKDFLRSYWPKLTDPFPSDFKIFQREVSTAVSPPNPPALDRTELAHWIPQNSPPKVRTAEEFRTEDLEFDAPENHPLASQL